MGTTLTKSSYMVVKEKTKGQTKHQVTLDKAEHVDVTSVDSLNISGNGGGGCVDTQGGGSGDIQEGECGYTHLVHPGGTMQSKKIQPNISQTVCSDVIVDNANGVQNNCIRQSSKLSKMISTVDGPVEEKTAICEKTDSLCHLKLRSENGAFIKNTEAKNDSLKGENKLVYTENKCFPQHSRYHKSFSERHQRDSTNKYPTEIAHQLAPLKYGKLNLHEVNIKKELEEQGILVASNAESKDPDVVLRELRQMGLVKQKSGRNCDATFETDDTKQNLNRLPPIGIDAGSKRTAEGADEMQRLKMEGIIRKWVFRNEKFRNENEVETGQEYEAQTGHDNEKIKLSVKPNEETGPKKEQKKQFYVKQNITENEEDHDEDARQKQTEEIQVSAREHEETILVSAKQTIEETGHENKESSGHERGEKRQLSAKKLEGPALNKTTPWTKELDNVINLKQKMMEFDLV